VLIDNWQAAMAHRRYADEAARRVRRAFAPWLDRPATALSKREAIQAVDRLASESGITAARRAAAYGRAMFAWAVKRDAVGTNPFAGIALPGREVARDRVLEAAELGAIWRAAGSLDPVRGGFVRLLLLTLQRRGEVAGLRRTELAPDLSTWTLPASRAKNNRAHVVHLAPLAREVLAGVPRLSGPPGDELVFASFRGPLGGFDRIKQRLDAAIAAEQGQPLAPWRLHDVRRSGVTFLAGVGIAPHVADRLLNHVGGTISGVAAVYQRNQFLPERRAALEAWARHLQACAAGIEITSNIVALR
jgi:integrase